MQTVLGDLLVSYEILDNKNKKNVLILHGWGQDSATWRSVAGKLSANHKVLLVDLPGFGGTSIPSQPYDTEKYAEFVLELTSKLKIVPHIIIGHSFGGKIAILLASRSDSNIAKLILISPSGIGNNTIVTKCRRHISGIFRPISNLLPRELAAKLINIFASDDYINAGELRDTFKHVVDRNAEDEAKKIMTKTLIVWGEKDDQVSVKNSKRLRSLIKGSTLRIMWGVRHSPHIEAPDKLVNLLEEYL